MSFAHGGAAEGPNFEALVLAAPLVVVGIILFVQKSAKPVVSVMLVVAGIALAYGGFTFLDPDDDHEEAQAAPTGDPRYAAAVQGLCETRDLLAERDVSGARAAFFDDAHLVLHEVADLLASEDRSMAAELLEAKQSIETGFEESQGGGGAGEEGASVPAIQAEVDELIIATVQGLAQLDVQVAGCE